jgi:hypothetical protein
MKRLVISATLALLAVLLIAVPVYAALVNPTSMSVVSVSAFRNLAEPGDVAIVFHADIEYSGNLTYPTTPASSTMLFRLYGADGTTLLSTVTPTNYSLFETYGYGDSISCFYFPASENLTWGSAFKINLYGLPAYFSGLSPVTINMASSDWNSENTSQENQRTAFYDYIVELGGTLSTIYPDVPLLVTTDGNVALSVYGESYLASAITGIYSLCPQLFFSQVYVPTVMTTQNYTMLMGTTYESRLEGTDIMRGMNRIGAYLGGVSGYFIFAFFTLGLAIFAVIFCIRKEWGFESGAVVAAGIILCSAILSGNILYTLVMVGSLIAIIALSWVFYHKRTA